MRQLVVSRAPSGPMLHAWASGAAWGGASAPCAARCVAARLAGPALAVVRAGRRRMAGRALLAARAGASGTTRTRARPLTRRPTRSGAGGPVSALPGVSTASAAELNAFLVRPAPACAAAPC